VRLAVLALPLALLLAACGHDMPEGGLLGAGAASTTAAPAAAGSSDPGSLGDAKHLCGPGTGTPPPSMERGVTNTEMKIGVVNDATNTLLPGLGQQYVDTAKAFAAWCNAAGGINGRKLTIVNRDGQLTNQAANTLDACDSDFMLVGGSTPADAQTLAPRTDCDLPTMPLYPADDTVGSPLQASITRSFAKQENVAGVKLLTDKYGDAFQRMGIVQIDLANYVEPTDRMRATLEDAGLAHFVSYQKIPQSADSARTYVQPLVGKAKSLYAPVIALPIFFQAMTDVGYDPDVTVDLTGNYDTWETVRAIQTAPPKNPVYSAVEGYPVDLADQNPTMQAIAPLNPPNHGEKRLDISAQRIWATWILFAQSASACTTKLTGKCVIDNALAQKDFTGGGLLAPTDISDPYKVSPCRVIIQVTGKDLLYDEKLTNPTDGVFNCDPGNVLPTKG
jgi:hypothetical protein